MTPLLMLPGFAFSYFLFSFVFVLVNCFCGTKLKWKKEIITSSNIGRHFTVISPKTLQYIFW